MSMIYLAEIDAAVDAIGTISTLRFSSGNYVTQPGETPSSAYYEPRLTQPGNMVRTMFSDATTAGKSSVGYGTMELENVDGGLDYMLGYGFDGRKMRLLVGYPDMPYSTFTVALRGTMEQLELSYKSVSIVLRDRQLELNQLLCKNRYGGTNILPAGKDGVADIKGAAIPRLYGTALNVSPVLVNTSKLIYQVHDGAINTISNVYDQGLALTKGADYTTLADVEVTAPTAGQFRVYPAGGYFRLGSSAAGQVTCDAQTGAAVANRTTAQILKQLALDMGIASGDISSADVTALDVINGDECGVFIKDDSTGLTVMDMVAASIGAYYNFDRLGVLRMARLDVPSGIPVLNIDPINMIDIDRERSNDANKGLPSYRVTCSYAKNFTVQSSGLAGAVADPRKLILGMPSQNEKSEDLTIKTQYLMSPEMLRDTILVSQSDAAAESSRLLTIFKAARNTFKTRIKIDAISIAALDLGAVVNVTYSRFAMDSGKLLRILGIEADYASNSATLTLWG